MAYSCDYSEHESSHGPVRIMGQAPSHSYFCGTAKMKNVLTNVFPSPFVNL